MQKNWTADGRLGSKPENLEVSNSRLQCPNNRTLPARINSLRCGYSRPSGQCSTVSGSRCVVWFVFAQYRSAVVTCFGVTTRGFEPPVRSPYAAFHLQCPKPIQGLVHPLLLEPFCLPLKELTASASVIAPLSQRDRNISAKNWGAHGRRTPKWRANKVIGTRRSTDFHSVFLSRSFDCLAPTLSAHYGGYLFSNLLRHHVVRRGGWLRMAKAPDNFRLSFD